MTVEEVMQYRRAIPFRPFVVAMKDGRRFEILQPYNVSRNSAFTRIGVADHDSGESFDISLVSHVELMEDAARTAQGK
jgi:hypothetical protein